MKYRVVSYCPDTHIAYDGRTPYDVGVGGGITARVRMAKALAELGHDVKMVVNCRRHEHIDGVEYIPLDQFRKADADVLIMNTSGGELDLSPAKDLNVRAALRIVWLHGTIEPRGLDGLQYDHTYAVSNFVAEVARQEWSATPKQIFVTYNAFEEQLFADAERSKPVRDPYGIIYFAHPSKGLDTAIEIVRLLRDNTPEFHLEVYGGNGLWCEKETTSVTGEGVIYRGLKGQRELTAALLKNSFSVQLQGVIESCPLSFFEASRAGCIVLASNVGAYPELINSGGTGFLITEDHRSQEGRRKAADLILELAENQDRNRELRRSSAAAALDTHRSAQTWVVHWDAIFDQSMAKDQLHLASCIQCGGRKAVFPDGYHCMQCGHFSWASSSIPITTPVPTPTETDLPRAFESLR